MADLPPLPPDMARIAGPLLVGYLLHWGLFGILSMQVYVYYLAFPNDHRGAKALVFGVYGVETAQTFVLAYSAFKAFASGFGDISAVADGGILWVSIPILGSIVAFVVQVFYAYRITFLVKSIFLTGLILMFATIQLLGGIATGLIAHQARTDFLVSRTSIESGIWNGGGAVCDVLISSAMMYSLFRPNASPKPTQRILRRYVCIIVETGTLTAAIVILNLTLYFLPGKHSYFQTSSVVLSKMYSTTMLVVFNSRMKLLRKVYGHSLNENILKTPISFSRTVEVTRDEYTLSLDTSLAPSDEKEEDISSSENHQE